MQPMKYREIIADRLHAGGWSYGIAEHLTKRGLLFCVDAHRDGKRFIVKADDLLTAFLSLKRDAIAPKEVNGNVRSVSLDALLLFPSQHQRDVVEDSANSGAKLIEKAQPTSVFAPFKSYGRRM